MRTRKVSAGWTYEGEGYTVLAQYTAGSADYFDRSWGNWLPGDPDEIEVLSVVEDSSERTPRPDLLDAASTDAMLLSRLADAASVDAVEEMYERAERAHDHADDERRCARGG